MTSVFRGLYSSQSSLAYSGLNHLSIAVMMPNFMRQSSGFILLKLILLKNEKAALPNTHGLNWPAMNPECKGQ